MITEMVQRHTTWALSMLRLRGAIGALGAIAALGSCGAVPEVRPGSRAVAHVASLVIPEQEPLVITGTGAWRVAPGNYLRSATGAQLTAGWIVIRGAHDLELDLTGVDLRGVPGGSDLDRAAGFGVVLSDCVDVTLRGGTIGGYKVCVAAFNCRNLVLDGLRFEGWYGQRLLSTVASENEADWLFPHKNDDGEWIENYGAAIALSDCDGATIARCSGRHGQNGILLVRTDDSVLYDDDFSFLSGWGLGLYRASRNQVSHCLFDYCVRGYSHGVYWRGQDSAGILMFERCSDNLFVKNSATHGGDGVFLFAGRDTVEGLAFERGEMDAGGSDRNVWFQNDFSYAVANSIEATFSRDNWAIGNRLSGSHQHGVWGGYSSRMVIQDNDVSHTPGAGVSIEHGQECAILGNRFEDDDIGLELWWDEDQGLVNGPYGKHRDTRSRGHLVSNNRFAHNARDIAITSTHDMAFRANEYASKQHALSLEAVQVPPAVRQGLETRPGPDAESMIAGVDGSHPSGSLRDVSIVAYPLTEPEWLLRARAFSPPDLPGTLATFASTRGERQGLDTIVMGEWGPWDFRSGEPRPRPRDPGGLLAGARWRAAWFSWAAGAGREKQTDPRQNLGAWRALARSPLVSLEVGAWTDPWGSAALVREAVGRTHFGLVATTSITLEAGGRYRLAITSDDGVRLAIDGRTVLENWTWHGPTRDTAEVELERGEHQFRLEYFQIDGASALAIELERASVR